MPPDHQGRQDHQSFSRPQDATYPAPGADTIVLVHGLWMGSWVMSAMGMRLRRCGFHTAFFSYPSMSNSLSRNALILSRFVAGLAASRIHFVGHSLGGLLILQMLAEFPEPRVGRVILAGSPYGACSVGTKLSRRGPGRHILGRSMLQWLNQAGAMHTTPDHPYELGVIAGCRSLGAGRLIARLPEPNDGVVTVEETRIRNARDEIVLNVSHSQMLVSAEVARQVCSFLRQGHFLHDKEQEQRGLNL
ncbi:alpha/beta fold hydrolase [Nitrosospira sp. Is2]|uniref:alpha/beta fold hydrolase n=1 Tax=Nitrosospira sp. Is2 TaxID=3080532 RepID=UPI002952DC38|nr:alpha/beta fold hydrolase [Nitrosospira sp. Is2]WON74241.1 alpha/beta fold hydrolase [Nitrosospira sp. Is2]